MPTTTNNMPSVYGTTTKMIYQLYQGGYKDSAKLSALRHGLGIDDHRGEAAWPLIFSTLDAKFLSDGKHESYAESAAYAALHSYAIYQQGVDGLVHASIYNPDKQARTLFEALATMRKADGTMPAGLERRMQSLFATTDYDAIVRSIYQLVRLLKGTHKNMVIDFAKLAQDLYSCQFSSYATKKVIMNWGRQYYWHANQSAETAE